MRVLQKEIKQKYKEIARKHNLELKDIQDVESSIWKMVIEKISEGNKDDFSSFHNIYIAGLGTFVASEGKWKHMNKKIKGND